MTGRVRAVSRAAATSCAAMFLGTAASGAIAQTVVPGERQPGFDAALAAKADAYDVQIHELMTPSLGYGLEAYVDDPGSRALIDAFFASGETDFQAQSGRHPYEVVSSYDEHGDLGMFGGVQAAGDAFRYAVLRDSGAPAAEVDRARENLLAAIDGLHWTTRVTGEPGILARGIRRITPEAGEPPLPGGPAPATLPLFDAAGNPQPADKSPTWRDDLSGELPFLIWIDDCSKDQIDGWVFALGAVYDVAHDDEAIPGALIDRLVDDARAIGLRLLEPVEVAPGVIADIVIQDADGRTTTHHDLSAEEVAPGAVLPGRPALNGFNAWMGLGILRTLYHITGDEEIGRFYYEELLGRRAYLDSVDETIHLMYVGNQTNFSNVNMAFVASYGVLRYETDDATWARARTILHDRLYAPGVNRQAMGLGQSLFDFIYAGFQMGAFARAETAAAEGVETLRQFVDPPYWDPLVENCDAAELAARRCIAIDGTTEIVIADTPGRGGGVVSVDPLPKRLREPSNFEWRSDPHDVNGGGGSRLNPGGDFHAAYWMGRFLAAADDNRAPDLRPAFEIPIPADGGVAGDGGTSSDGGSRSDGGGGGGDGGGCGCAAARTPRMRPLAWAALAAVAILGAARRSRREAHGRA